MDMDTIALDTVMGPKNYPAPAGWDWSQSMRRRVWAALLTDMKAEVSWRGAVNAHSAIQRRARMNEAASLLGRDMGKAAFYWAEAARYIAEKEE